MRTPIGIKCALCQKRTYMREIYYFRIVFLYLPAHPELILKFKELITEVEDFYYGNYYRRRYRILFPVDYTR